METGCSGRKPPRVGTIVPRPVSKYGHFGFLQRTVSSRFLRAPGVPQLGQSMVPPPPNKLVRKSSNPIWFKSAQGDGFANEPPLLAVRLFNHAHVQAAALSHGLFVGRCFWGLRETCSRACSALPAGNRPLERSA